MLKVKAFTRWMRFFMKIICTKKYFGTADWPQLFSSRMRLPCRKKAALLDLPMEFEFPSLLLVLFSKQH